jgi:hypothetical protein
MTLRTFGTCGDVQPCIALGVGLREAEKGGPIVTHKGIERLISAHDLEACCLNVDPRSMLLR